MEKKLNNSKQRGEIRTSREIKINLFIGIDQKTIGLLEYDEVCKSPYICRLHIGSFQVFEKIVHVKIIIYCCKNVDNVPNSSVSKVFQHFYFYFFVSNLLIKT